VAESGLTKSAAPRSFAHLNYWEVGLILVVSLGSLRGDPTVRKLHQEMETAVDRSKGIVVFQITALIERIYPELECQPVRIGNNVVKDDERAR
jgi:hypothetical protein